jgi:hypothetical protein
MATVNEGYESHDENRRTLMDPSGGQSLTAAYNGDGLRMETADLRLAKFLVGSHF